MDIVFSALKALYDVIFQCSVGKDLQEIKK
jgi:hypothetical protein